MSKKGLMSLRVRAGQNDLPQRRPRAGGPMLEAGKSYVS